MLQALVRTASQLLTDVNRRLVRERPPLPHPSAPPLPTDYQPLQRVLLTDGVARTLFEEYAAHRAEARGDEEIGWVLLGRRNVDHAVVLATLPAGAERDAGVAHVLFNSSAQALGSRIVRQADRRLTPVGVVHTHPGSLRHPTDADYRGDSQWVLTLPKGGPEGVFGIGTADGRATPGALFAEQPRPNVQCFGELCLSWYVLRHGDPGYRTVPVGLTLGPDLARPLHSVWLTIEAHAERLERLFRQQAGITFDVATEGQRRWLVMHLPLAGPYQVLRVLLQEKQVRYFLVRDDELLEVECGEERVDRGVYLLLADLAAKEV
jgi:proteasome lid subunit RPN8/RPN11